MSTPGMEFVWVEWTPNQEGMLYIKTTNRIKLFRHADGGTIKFNGETPGGAWLYDEKKKLMLVEFVSSFKPQPARRHALLERDDGSFQLLPYSHEVYSHNDEWHAGTVPHMNENYIIMQKIFPPSVPRG